MRPARAARGARPYILTRMDATAIPPQLAAIAEEQFRLDARVARLMVAVTDAQWGQRRDPAAWSVAENFAHLNLTSAAMVPRLREAWGRARPSTSPWASDGMLTTPPSKMTPATNPAAPAMINSVPIGR